MAIFVRHFPWEGDPVLICDCCNKEIKDATELSVHWDIMGPNDEDGLMFYFLHKQCKVPFLSGQLLSMLTSGSFTQHLKVTVADWWH